MKIHRGKPLVLHRQQKLRQCENFNLKITWSWWKVFVLKLVSFIILFIAHTHTQLALSITCFAHFASVHEPQDHAAQAKDIESSLESRKWNIASWAKVVCITLQYWIGVSFVLAKSWAEHTGIWDQAAASRNSNSTSNSNTDNMKANERMCCLGVWCSCAYAA